MINKDKETAKELTKDVDLTDDLWERSSFVEEILSHYLKETNIGSMESETLIKQVGEVSYALSLAYTKMQKEIKRGKENG